MFLVFFSIFIEKLISNYIKSIKMTDLSVKDVKILYHLSKNGRMSHSELGKLIGMSKNAVTYRINNLIKEGVITNFSSIINTGALNCTSFSVLLKFTKNPYKNEEILNFFKEHPYTLWVVSLSGTYDIYAEFITKSFNHINQIMREIKNYFGETLNHYELHLIEETLRVEHLIGDIYNDLKLENKQPKKRGFKEIKLDELDKKILEVISDNSDKNFVEIAKEVNSTWDVVRYRLKHMENAGIILDYFPEINLAKLGYAQFIGQLKMRNSSKEEFDKIKHLFKHHPNVSYAFINASAISILFHCSFKKIEALDSFLGEIQESFKDNILSIDYYLIKEQLKFDLFPKGMLE